MRVTLDWLQLVLVVGAVQGLLLGGVLLVQRGNRTANRLLAALMLACTVFLAATVYFSADLFRAYPHFVGVSYQMPWLFGPLLYLYAVAASDRAWRFRSRQTLHFAPAAVSLLATFPYYMMSGEEKIALYERMSRGDFPVLLSIIDPFKYVLGIGYSIAMVMYLTRHRRAIENSYSNTEQVNLSWLMLLTGAAVAIWVLAVTLKLGGLAGRLRDEHIALAISVVIYGMGYMGLRQPEIFRYETAEYPIPEDARSLAPAPVAVSPRLGAEKTVSSAARYERSGLGDREAKRLKESLLAIMGNEQPWKNSELTLSDLATRLDITPHNLSEILNLEIGQTFYDFVNGYRVREVQRRIASGEAKALKMLSLALDAGFASKSTFNQVFKKHTSQTPSDYRQAAGE